MGALPPIPPVQQSADVCSSLRLTNGSTEGYGDSKAPESSLRGSAPCTHNQGPIRPIAQLHLTVCGQWLLFCCLSLTRHAKICMTPLTAGGVALRRPTFRRWITSEKAPGGRFFYFTDPKEYTAIAPSISSAAAIRRTHNRSGIFESSADNPR